MDILDRYRDALKEIATITAMDPSQHNMLVIRVAAFRGLGLFKEASALEAKMRSGKNGSLHP